jgi:para-nitrobenzyl esterase
VALLALALALVACTGDELRVTIDSGTVHGKATGAMRRFLGIPYAAPPTYTNRFRTPQPVARWSGTLETTAVGPECPQTFLGSSDDEDCLYLNVFAPSGAHALPVMVWLHGGAFISGSGGEKFYDGGVLAGYGAVVVTLNYRLGAFGFLAHPMLDVEDPAYPTSGNYGFEDQRAALEWVQRNIHAFGGDPSRVTLFGESAGGFSTCVHYLSSRDHGLFGAAIVESGLCGASIVTTTHAIAQSQGAALATALGCSGSDASTIACLRAMPADTILSATMLPPLMTQTPGGMFYQTELLPTQLPNVDGYVIAAPLRDALAAGAFEPRPLIVGSNADEGTLFHSSVYAREVADETQYRAALAVRFGATNADAIVAHYPVASYASANDALAHVSGDAFFVCPARTTARGAANAGAHVFRYALEQPLENPFEVGLGVFHGSDLPFVFGNDDFPLGHVGSSGASLALAMQAYWTSFAKTHAPAGATAWPAYDPASDPYLVLAPTIAPANALSATACDFWDTLP